ncbi:glycyl-radical enzyme activating protein [Treponema primitia]|uniref:glycyl-radical enzyme activating protein n=1 Tax=Treponema primitia TaxID=88058 RepID=UPI0039800E8D
MEGLVFDIRRFSTHDGDGIRTTVFLKGCPLRCRWCQNPEGLAPKRRPLWFADRCIRCRSCTKDLNNVSSAQPPALEWKQDTLYLNSNTADETDWEGIMKSCPTRALRWDSRSITVEALMAELERDAVFYRNGGGITLSGGEPLFQADFSIAVLRAAGERGFNTAIETSLFAEAAVVDRIIPLAGTIFADCKVLDDAAHHAATGQSNRMILENLRTLLRGEHPERVVVRTPLIPGYTATEKNIAAIGRHISALYPEVRYELLNYNPLAAGKYPLVGMEYCFEENPKRFSPEAMERFSDIARRNGIKNLIPAGGSHV